MRVGSWWLVFLLFLTASSSFLCRVNISVTGALMMRDLGFSQIEMGRLFSAFVLGYALFQVPAGVAADRWGARRTLAWAAFSWVAATMLAAAIGWVPLVSAAGGMLILRFVLGVGEAPTFPAAGQGVAKWIQLPKQGLATGVVLAAIGAGSIVAPLMLSRVMVRGGWRIAMLTSAIPALIVALAWLSVREPDILSTAELQPRSAEGSVRRIWTTDFALLTLSYTLEGYVANLFIFWNYLYLVQVRHFDLVRAGSLSTLPWLLSAISIPMGGHISDRLVAGAIGRRWGRRAVPVLGFTSAGVFLALGAATTHAYFAVGYLTLATASVFAVEAPFWATMMGLAGLQSGTAGGVMNMGSNIGGLISPALTPILASLLGWRNALFVGAGISIIAGALWFGISTGVQAESNRKAFS